jgi:hypothetical protein
MPKYHFEFRRPDGAVLYDEQGKELPDLDAAKAFARTAIANHLKGAAASVDWSTWRAVIKNPDGDELGSVPFREVM